MIYAVINAEALEEDAITGASFLSFEILDELEALSDEVGDRLREVA